MTMATESGRERRKFPRIPVMMQVNYTDGEDFLIDYSTNLGPNGIFINTTRAFAAGEKLHLKFHLPGHERPLRILGKVRWARKRDSDPAETVLPGIGIEFVHATEHARDAVARFVERFLPAPDESPIPDSEVWEPEDWHKINDLYQGDRV
jgi:uncharacterized protein (TIGR02266 family)